MPLPVPAENDSLQPSVEVVARQFERPIAHWRASDNTPHYLDIHLADVSVLCSVFAGKLGLHRAGKLIGLLHDLGKYSQEFRSYIGSALGLVNADEDDYIDADKMRGKVDHSSAGAQFIWRELAEKSGWELRTAQVLSLCVASHHSGLIDCLDPNGEDTFGKRMRKMEQKTHVDEAWAAAAAHIRDEAMALVKSPELTAEISELVKRIAESNTTDGKVNPQLMLQHIGLSVRFLFSCLIDADRIDTADFEHKRTRRNRPTGKYVAWAELIGRLEKHLASLPIKRPIDGLRREISQHCLDAAARDAGVYTLTVPTGGGKTLASLRFALHHAERRKLDRIIYVIPFTSIIDQNAQVVRQILEPESEPRDKGKVVLEHHSSVTPEQQNWREKILCENWDAPVVYTTMVQFLESLFGAGTRGARRMHQLANAVLVFDEIQTLPVKCVHLFNNAINFLIEQCNSTVVLCTATQPLLDKVAPEKGAIRLAAQHELVRDVQKLFDDLKRVDIKDRRKPGGWTHAQVAQLALDEVRRVGSCLVIVNTKNAARQVFEASQFSVDQEALFHLSTDMCPAHRKQELAKVRIRLDSDLPVLCVSTQLIEAGVDVDFAAVIRFLAGLDSIAQAAGRCNRNGRPEMGWVHVVNPAEESLSKLPDIAIGREKAERVLDDFATNSSRYRDNLVSPEALTDYYQYYFFERQNDMVYRVPASQLGHDDTIWNLLSTNDQSVSDHHRKYRTVPVRLLNQSFMAAAKAFKSIDAPTQGVIVPHGDEGKALINDLCAAFEVEKQYKLLKKAQQFTVNVFPHVLQKLHEAQALQPVQEGVQILHLLPHFYSPQFGLSTEPVSLMEPLCVDTTSK